MKKPHMHCPQLLPIPWTLLTRMCVCGLMSLPMVVNAQSSMQGVPSDRPPRLIAPVMPVRGPAMLPLQRMVRVALDRSPAAREAAANWRSAQQEVAQSKAGLWPRLEVSGNTSAAKLDNGTADTAKGGVGAVASYTLLDFGRTNRQIDARQQLASSMQAKVQLARETTAYETVNAYLQLLKHERLIKIYEQHMVELSDLVGKLSEIVAVFEGRASELTQAKTRLAQTRDALNVQKARKRDVQLQLLRQIGQETPTTIDVNELPQFPADTRGFTLDQAIQRHPLLVAARAEAASAAALVEEAKAAQEPQVELQLAKQSGKNVLNQSHPLQLYVSAKWTAFQGFGDKANELALSERAQAANERINQLKIELEFNLNSAWAEFEAQSTRVEGLRDLLNGTDQVRQDYYVQWRDLGKRSLLDVLTAENEHLNTQLSYVTSEIDREIALAKVRHEAGMLKEWLVGDEGTAVADNDLPVSPPDAPEPVIAAPLLAQALTQSSVPTTLPVTVDAPSDRANPSFTNASLAPVVAIADTSVLMAPASTKTLVADELPDQAPNVRLVLAEGGPG